MTPTRIGPCRIFGACGGEVCFSMRIECFFVGPRGCEVGRVEPGEVCVAKVLLLFTFLSKETRRPHVSRLRYEGLGVNCRGALRVVFPAPIGCLGVKSRGVVKRIVRMYPSIVQLGSAMESFGKRAGLSIIARSDECCACYVSFSRKTRTICGRNNAVPRATILPISSRGLARIVCPRGVICISFKGAAMRIRGTRGIGGVITLETISPFTLRAGLATVARDNEFCAFSLQCTPKYREFSFVISGRSAGGGRITVLRKERQGAQRGTLLRGRVSQEPGLLAGVESRITNVEFYIAGVFISGSVLLFHFKLRGHSRVNCAVSFVHFCVRSTGGQGGATIRRLRRRPLFSFGHPRRITTLSSYSFAITLPGFAVPSGGILVVRVRREGKKERFCCGLGGGRLVGTRVLFPRVMKGPWEVPRSGRADSIPVPLLSNA